MTTVVSDRMGPALWADSGQLRFLWGCSWKEWDGIGRGKTQTAQEEMATRSEREATAKKSKAGHLPMSQGIYSRSEELTAPEKKRSVCPPLHRIERAVCLICGLVRTSWQQVRQVPLSPLH